MESGPIRLWSRCCCESLHYGWWGLFCAGALSASMVTGGACALAAAATIGNDLLQPRLNWPDRKLKKAIQLLVFTVVGAAYIIALMQPALIVYIILMAYAFTAQMPIKLKNAEPAPEQPQQHGQSDQPGPTATRDERTRHLCKLLEAQFFTGKVHLSFGDYIRLMQWREAKGYNRPNKTVVTWSDPWWLALIEEMEGHPELKAVIADFKAKGLSNRKKDPHA
jgi:hypothetical protein